MNIKSADWRRQLRINDRRSKVVIILFILIYLMIGFLIDLYLQSGTIYSNAEVVYIPIGETFKNLITFKIFPIATVITGLVAMVSIFITFAYHDKLMLLGTSYREITPETAKSLEERQLYNVVEEMKTASSLDYMPKVYLIEANYMNAFASGYSEKSALIAVTRGLLSKLERDELQAVMAHELSHIQHHDIKLTLMATVLSNIMLIAIDFL